AAWIRPRWSDASSALVERLGTRWIRGRLGTVWFRSRRPSARSSLVERLGTRWIRSHRSRVLHSSTGQRSGRRFLRCYDAFAGELTWLGGCRDGRLAMVFGSEQRLVLARRVFVLEL